MDDRLSLSVTHADGRVTRWGPDEVDAGNVPSDLQFSTAMPGGFRDLSCSLLRRIDLEYPDQALFDNVRAYGPGNQTAWDGRFTQFPRSHGSGFSVTPGAVGWAAHLRDDPSFQEIYRDIDLSHWDTIPNDVRAQLIGILYTDFADPVTATSPSPTGGPALRLSLAFTGGSKPYSGAYYDAGAVTIGSVFGSYVASNAWGAPTSRYVELALLTRAGGSDVSADLEAVSNATTVTATTGTRDQARVQFFWNAAATAGAGTNDIYWDVLAVYGTHGLTKYIQDGGIASFDDGLLASDIIGHIVSTGAPMLDTSGIDTSDFVIPHCVFLDPTTPEDALTLVNAYQMWEWGVYDNRVFFYREPDLNRLVWEARLDQGAFLDLEGDTGEEIYNGVFVTYQDASGKKKTVGPPGARADATSSQLEDSADTNPVNSHGIPRRWAKFDISVPTTEAGATQLGYVWLREHSLPQRRGNLTLTGSAYHPTEGPVPAWRPRAGDSVRINDGGVSDVPRRIISTQYNHASRSISMSLDNTSFKLDAILERLGIGLTGVL